ncbi:glycosyltransferase [Chitinispirillales bacterium ANBcel5]|uniref:glycosyltransferase n=1 Tax=Cellulosispirillum alkaliphilum TaxID=3039283 RepID=UPI002A51980C|nr:glycosyltransferase [Chitinispirillales bacterium ANBcel5]
MSSALIHEWLVTVAGAESVLRSIYKLYPGTIYTLFHDKEALKETLFEKIPVETSLLQKIPFAKKHHRLFVPFYPLAVEQHDLRDHKLIISSSYAVAKGVLNSSDQLHICYCHSPMRYAWDLMYEYLEAEGLDRGAKSVIVRMLMHYLRMWDYTSANRVNEYVTNSHYIAHRIKKCYNRRAKVIYPPVNIDNFKVSDRKDNYFITVSRLVSYKRIDLIIKAFNRLKLPLVIVGDGPSRKKLEKIANGNIEFLGYVPSPQLSDLLSKARAFVFSAEEDFGIVNVEAQASGIPVIAFGRGGALETVVEGKTGLFFRNQTVESLMEKVHEFLATEDSFDPQQIRKNAERFPRSRFETEFKQFVDNAWERFPYKG